MSEINRIIAAHPLEEMPYIKIQHSHLDGQRQPIYKIEGVLQNAGAKLALAHALEKYGGSCFHCGKKFKPTTMSQQVTRDHIRPKSKGGGNHLHNLVIACGPCNKNKGDKELARCRADATERYLKALDAHLVKCLEAL